MDDARPTDLSSDTTRTVFEQGVRLVVVGLLAYWCFRIVLPFLMPIAWGIILAVERQPACLALLFVPVVLLSESVVEGARALSSQIEQGDEGELRVPSAPESVAGWPVIGPTVCEAWQQAATSLETFLRPFRPQLLAFGKWLVGFARGAAFAVILTAISVVIVALFLVRRESASKVALHVGEKLGGDSILEEKEPGTAVWYGDRG